MGGIACEAAEFLLSFTSVPNENEVYETMMSFQSKYPEKMSFTNSTSYVTMDLFPNVHFTGRGCAAFAAELSDAAFGKWPARISYDFSNLRVGDMIRLADDSHSVIVLGIDGDTVTIAEANYNSRVHWGRTLSLSSAETEWNYIVTRYPE